MNLIPQLASLGGWELVLIMAVVLILLGAGKLPDLQKGLVQGLKEFMRASDEVGRGGGESWQTRGQRADALKSNA
ncbi:MAG: twin-arginine translocase TatA/TatE family subunit [Pedosphaera sp.]|nr:twin-arginine translocase TatA/TatE family subunit [Pedosphaera sp.]